MIKNLSLSTLFIDCQNPQALREFYHRLTGWPKQTVYDMPSLRTENGLDIIFTECEVPHVPPVWPEEAGKQQKQMHFDFAVADLQAAVEEAVKLSAVKAPEQYGDKLWVTLLDPAGHPFCFGAED